MASSKSNNFKVKLKTVPQKKRRKSDLVVMWHSLVDAIILILTTIHFLLLGLLESARLMIWHDEVHEIRKFLKKYLPIVPDDFSNSWRDGKLLCILLNKLQPGCIPDAEILDHNYALRNMYYAFDILERKFGISPTATVEQLVVCVEGSHLKLLEILSQLKNETENKLGPSIVVEEVEPEIEKHSLNFDSKNCISKGTGLMVAFIGRPANFVIFTSTVTDISLVIEIKGPNDTLCRERITKRSPKKKNSTSLLEQSRPPFYRSNSYTEKNDYQTEVDKANDCDKNLIPLEYDISLDKISVTYIPIVEGEHIISILWYGQHVSDSPYVVKVERAIVAKSVYSNKQFIPTYNLQDTVSDDNSNKERKNGTVTIQKPVNKIEKIGKVMKRRVLRYIVKIKDKDIIVDSHDLEHLAASLLKMDYEIQTDPSKSRRNSWGFDGDAERKISAIRQFFIPLHELDSQNMILHGRSRSLTINSNPRMPLKRSNSLEDEGFVKQTKLETVSEDHSHTLSESFQFNEEDFAYLNEDFQTPKTSDDQVDILNKNIEEVIMPSSTFNNGVQDKLLLSLPIKEDNGDIRNDMNARLSLELQQNHLTGSSEFSEKPAVQKEIEFRTDKTENNTNNSWVNANPVDEIKESCEIFKTRNYSNEQKNDLNGSNVFYEGLLGQSEMQCNADIYDDIEKELKLNAYTTDEITESIEVFNTRNYSRPLQNDLNFLSTSCKIPQEIQYNSDISTDIEKELTLNANTISGNSNNSESDSIYSKSLTSFNENFSNLNKYDVPFYNFRSEENSEMTLQFSSSPITREGNIRKISSYKSYKNFQQLKQRNRNDFESKKCCKSCKRLKILSRKLINRKKKVNENDSLYSANTNSESFYTNGVQNGDVSLTKNIKMNLNTLDESNNDSPKGEQDKHAKISKLKYFESPNQYSFYYYSQVPNNHINPLRCPQTNSKVEKNAKTSNIINNALPLPLKTETCTDLLKNSYPNNLYNSSTLFCNSLDLTPSGFENPMTNFKEVSKLNESLTKEHNLISLGQYNFNQFNPSAEKNKGSLIKNRIKKLEGAMIRDSQKVSSKFSSRSSISSDTVNVKNKLTFWENLSNKDEKIKKAEKVTDNSIAKGNFQKEFLVSNANGLENNGAALNSEKATDNLFWQTDDVLNDFENSLTPNRERINLQPADSNHIELPLQPKQNLKMKRSFSDPMLLSSALRGRLSFDQNPLHVLTKQNHISSTDNMSSSGDYLESSIDDGMYSSDPFVSTEDEYIDDEIPGNPLLTHWGDLDLMTSLKTASMSKYKEYCQFIDTEILKNQFQSAEICPSECKVFGIGTYYGYVAIKNRFQVLTKGAGNGNLSASVQGFGPHDVSYVSVKYKHKDIYEVTYQVLRPGLYLISLRWMEKPIVGSPFLCKVTF